MKYFFIIPTLTIGGAESIFLSTCNELSKKGDAVEIILFSNKIEYVVSNNLIIHKFIGGKGVFRFLHFCFLNRKKGAFISYMERANFLNLIASALFKINKSYLSVHTAPKFGFKTRSKVKRCFIYILYNMASLFKVNIITVSKGIADELEELYGLKRISVLPNFLDTKKIGNVPEIRENKSNQVDEKVKLLFVGRLAPVKGCDVLLDAIKRCSAAKHLQLTIVGDGPMRERYEEFVSDNGLMEKVKFIGKVENTNTYMLDADYLIVPSYAEGFGIVILEGLLSGCGIVYSMCDFGPKELMLNSFNHVSSHSFYDPSANREKSVTELSAIISKLKKTQFDMALYTNTLHTLEQNFTAESFVNKLKCLVK